jgi:biopolymer transport protein ExbB/TolQ
MGRGIGRLATIAAIAPLLGLVITVEGITHSFVGCGGEKSACMAALVERLANSVTRSAIGLLVGVMSLLCYRYLRTQLDGFAGEMKCMTLELALLLGRRGPYIP